MPYDDDASTPLVDAAADAPEAASVVEAGAVDAGADAPADAEANPCGPENLCVLYGGPAIGH
jgi:hypothetical protein